MQINLKTDKQINLQLNKHKSWQIALLGTILCIIVIPIFFLLSAGHGGFESYNVINEIIAFHIYAFIFMPFVSIPFFLILILTPFLLYTEKTRKSGAYLSIILGVLKILPAIMSILASFYKLSNFDIFSIIFSLSSGILFLTAGIYYFRGLKLNNSKGNSVSALSIPGKIEAVTAFSEKCNSKNRTLIVIVVLSLIIIGSIYYFMIVGGKKGKNQGIKYSESCVNNCLMSFDKIIAYGGFGTIDDVSEDRGNVYVFDTSIGKKTIINSRPGNIKGVSKYENKVVWTDDKAMYIKDISNGEESELNGVVSDSIKIFKDKIVFIQDDNIFLYDLNTKVKNIITDNTASRTCIDLYDNNMVSTERNKRLYSGIIIYLYDINNNSKTKIDEISERDENLMGLCPSIYKNKIAYGKDNKIYLYDINTANISELVNNNLGSILNLTLFKNKLKYLQITSSSSMFDNYSVTGKCVLMDLDSKENKDITCTGGVYFNGWLF